MRWHRHRARDQQGNRAACRLVANSPWTCFYDISRRLAPSGAKKGTGGEIFRAWRDCQNRAQVAAKGPVAVAEQVLKGCLLFVGRALLARSLACFLACFAHLHVPCSAILRGISRSRAVVFPGLLTAALGEEFARGLPALRVSP